MAHVSKRRGMSAFHSRNLAMAYIIYLAWARCENDTHGRVDGDGGSG